MEKIVQEMGDYELVSWQKSDTVHYGIRQKSKTDFLQTYAPTPGLKGWDLRKRVVGELQRIASEIKVPEVVKLPDTWFPEDWPGAREMKIPRICWNPVRYLSSRCDACHYSFMCRVPLKKYPKGN